MMWDAASRVLEDAIDSHAFPGASAEVGGSSGARWDGAAGALTYETGAPAATAETLYDLASLTKVIATTTVAMRFADAGRIGLDDLVSRWLPAWAGTDRAIVTIRDLLAHCSGLTAHLPFYRDFATRPEFKTAICQLALEYAPRTRAEYSDLGFMLLAFILEDAGGRRLDALFEDVLDALGHPEILFRPSPAMRSRTAPTQVDMWRGRLLTGEVDDQNAWALGGVAGHAGLFGTASSVGCFARTILAARRAAAGLSTGTTDPDVVARPATVAEFSQRTAVPGSSRALGWDTMLPTSSCGTLMRPTAIGHTGYTGTSLWIDWEQDIYIVLLTNRVHPTAENQQILGVRRRFHDAVMKGMNG